MWTRSELKSRAKQVLRTSYWKGFLVSLLLGILGAGLPSCNAEGRTSGSGNAGMPGILEGLKDGASSTAMISVIVVAILAIFFIILAFIAFQIFVSAPLEVGARQYFKQAAIEEANLNHVVYAFGKGKYLATVKGMFWKGLLNFLWFLLLIIPGIVKYYAYSQVPYILADNPGIGTKRAVELSMKMTRGHKWRMFVLDLSFIGWYLLGCILFIIGVLFVLPYINATKAELYLVLRQKALEEGMCNRAELGLAELG